MVANIKKTMRVFSFTTLLLSCGACSEAYMVSKAQDRHQEYQKSNTNAVMVYDALKEDYTENNKKNAIAVESPRQYSYLLEQYIAISLDGEVAGGYTNKLLPHYVLILKTDKSYENSRTKFSVELELLSSDDGRTLFVSRGDIYLPKYYQDGIEITFIKNKLHQFTKAQ
jgi:ABC-type enterochelin transport system substrate-binding protein